MSDLAERMQAFPEGSAQAACARLVLAPQLEDKLAAGARLLEAPWTAGSAALRLEAPGRPPQLALLSKVPRSFGREALRHPRKRAELLQRLMHHELQAAELFAWGALAFAAAPLEFRRGLARLAREELAHLELYRERLHAHDARYGDFAVRDWFWERVPSARDPLSFNALMGLGLEAANLEHSQRLARDFRSAGDAASAAVLERVGAEEVAHVAFGRRWFEHFRGAPLDFRAWSAALPPPLTPSLLRGLPLQREARRRAGLDDHFLDALAAAPSTSIARSRP